MTIGDGGVGIGWDDASDGLAMWIEVGDGPVSYTHLTLPTKA